MKDFWNERYQAEEFAYGIEPNQFLANEIRNIKSGNMLLPFEGEGRNAVFCAKENWEVDAFDFSEKGKQKAEALANLKNVQINYQVSALENFKFKSNYYDAVALVFAHPSPDKRKMLHQQAVEALKPGGTILVEAFHEDQITKTHISGGPKKKEMLYSEAMLQQDFEKLQIEKLEVVYTELEEGKYHRGEAYVIRLIAKKQN